ncbi:MAG: hypothetical protein KGD65_04665 [Candidatus Lokiarchaeota archaeon]|nr:hypothetical protein [Candidatus Lokiarchaeota archaeon]
MSFRERFLWIGEVSLTIVKDSLNLEYDSISPSAKSLLLTKAFTTIPFAREAAGLIWGENFLRDSRERLSSLGFILRVIHFEKRYWSIDEALRKVGMMNILEFSSGFSFRGLSMCKDPEICYIDTDLPQIIKTKEPIVQELSRKYCDYPIDNLVLKPLDVFDENAFIESTNQFSNDPIAIVNEGLLVYFDEGQKRKLCEIIHNLLNAKGGYWITSDIYIKNEIQDTITNGFYEKKGEKFLEEHHVEENKFDNFKVAEDFFKGCGFEIYMKIDLPTARLSSRKLLVNIPRIKLKEIKTRKKIRETWILKPKE